MRINNNLAAAIMAGACMASVPCVSALAQDMGKDTVNLAELEVVGNYRKPSAVSKLPVAIIKSPLSVSVVGSEKIKDLAVTSMVGLTRNMTGIRPNNTYGGFQTFTVRGFSDFVLLNDGIRDERHNLWASAPNTNLASIERVEVLKGAASVMFGHSALGGVINLIHKKPTKENHVNARMGIGSWGKYLTEAGASGTICKGLTFRTDFSMSGGEGWRHTNERIANGYLALNWEMTDYDNLFFSVSAKDDRYGSDTGQPHFMYDIYDNSGKLAYSKGDINSVIDRRTRYADPTDHLNDKDITYLLDYTHYFNNRDWRINDHASYYHDNLSYYATEKLNYLTSATQADGYDHYYMNGGNKMYIDINHINRQGFAFDYKVNLFQNQLELHGKAKTGNVDHSLMFGYNLSVMFAPRYQNAKFSGPGHLSVIDVVNPELNQGYVKYPFQKLNEVWENNHGIYVGDYMQITEKLSALASVRFDNFNRTFRQSDVNGTEVVKANVVDKKMSDNAFTYRASLLYQFNDAVNVYGSASNFYKPTRTYAQDGYVYIGSDGKELTPDGGNVFKPISGYQFEIGSHIGLGRRLTANAAAFYIKKNNMIESLGKTADNKNISAQVGCAESKGFEFDVLAEPVDGWTIDAGYTFTDARVTEFSSTEIAKSAQEGNYLTHAPKHMYYGWTYYRFHENCVLNGFRAGVGFNGTSKAYVNAANTMEFNPYTVMNAMVSYQFKNWKLQCNVNNIFDKTYYTTAVSTTGFIPEEGRNVMFTASFSM